MMSRILCWSLMYAFPHSRLMSFHCVPDSEPGLSPSIPGILRWKTVYILQWAPHAVGKMQRLSGEGGAPMRGGPRMWRSHGKLSGLVPKVLPENAPIPFTHLWHSPYPSRPNTCNLWAQGTLQLTPQLCLLQLQTRVPKDEQFLGAALGQWLTKLVSEYSRNLPQVRQPRTWASS